MGKSGYEGHELAIDLSAATRVSCGLFKLHLFCWPKIGSWD